MPIDEACEKTKKFDRDDPKAKAFHRKITEFMAFDDKPFSVAEDLGFRQIMNHLELGHKVPSRCYFADTFTRIV